MKRINLQYLKFPIYSVRFRRLNLIYSNLCSNPTSEYSSVFGIWIHFSWSQLPDAISSVREEDNRSPSRHTSSRRTHFKQSVTFVASTNPEIHLRNEYRFYCAFARSSSVTGKGSAPTIPLIVRVSCHGVLTRKHVYSGNNIDAGPRETRIWF